MQVDQSSFHSAFQYSGIGMALVSRDGKFMEVNDSLLRIVGYNRHELIEMTFQQITHPDDLERDLSSLEAMLDGKIATYQMEKRYFHRDGHVVWVLLTVSSVQSQSGELAFFVSQVQDITDQKIAEEELSLKAKELARMNSELEQFVYFASHDLQEPLRKLISFSEYLKEDVGEDLNENAAKDLFFITDAARRMKNLVHDLLELSRASRSELARRPVDLGECVEQALCSLGIDEDTNSHPIHRAQLPVVHGDRGLLTSLYQNLINNAMKFSAEGSVIELTVEQGDSQWILGVKDSGIGLSTEYADLVFLPFKRLHTRDKYDGTGIGLAICRKTVERHGGKIWFESIPGQGAHFRFTLSKEHQETLCND